MIDALSSILGNILQHPPATVPPAPDPDPLANVNVSFARPDDQFQQGQATVDIFLYDVREDVGLRDNQPVTVRSNGQVTIVRPPLRVACSYLATAWAIDQQPPHAELALQEQRMLSRVLQIFSNLPTIPDTLLKGTELEGQEPPLPMITAVVDPQKNLSEFWTALGARLRPSVTVKATVSLDVFRPNQAAKVITKELRLGERTSPDEEQLVLATTETVTRIGIGGLVTDTGNLPVSGAEVSLPELGLVTLTDVEGRYRFSLEKPGTLTMQVKRDDKQQTSTIQAAAGSEIDVQLT